MFPRRWGWHCAKGIFCVVDLCIVAFHYSTYRVKLCAKTFLIFDAQIGKMFIIDNDEKFKKMPIVECVLVKLGEARAVLLHWQIAKR